MKCTCPKCHAKIELDLPEVTEAGSSAACPACNARFSVYRESFGARALHRSGEISCAACGEELGAQLHCPSCGMQFPDYLAVSLGRKRARRESKKIKLKTSPFPKPAGSTSQLPSLEMSMMPEPKKPGKTLPSLSRSSKPALIAGLVVIVALIAAGAFFYTKYQAEKAFTKNFVLATYCIQMGTDISLKESARISAEWKAKADLGQAYQGHLGIDAERDTGIINRRLDGFTQKLSNPPQKFSQCPEKLAKLQAAYNKVHALVASPGNSLPNFSDASRKLDGEYRQAAKELKAGIPEEVMSELVSAGKKYRGLKPLLSI